MVTLRPDHPHSIASARPLGDTSDATRTPGSVGANRRGRHRTRIGWNLYRSAHRDPERGGLARLLPSWRYRPARSKPAPRDLPLPDTTPEPAPVSDLETTDLPTTVPSNGDRPVPRTMTVDRPPDSSIDLPLARRSTAVPQPDHSYAAVTELTNSQLLPLAHPADGSSLAALLGFGETEASFGGDWMDGNGSNPAVEPADDPWNHLPSLSAVTADLDRPGNTGDAVKLLWDATAELDMDEGLLSNKLTDVQLRLRSSRRIRWSLVVSSALLALLIGVTVKVISDLPEREVGLREVQYAAAARQLSDALVPIEQSLGAEGLLSDSGLSTLTGQLNALDGAARASATLASEQLPRAPIVGSRLPIDELILPKRLLESASIQALGVGQRIGNAMTYSLLLSTAFDLPPLPAEAPLTEVDRIAEQLSISIAETRLDLTGLPDDPFFGTFRQQASDTVSMVEQAQADYIAGLRDGDTTRAAHASAEMHDSITILQEGLHVPLGQVQTWALGQIAQLRSTVTEIESIVAA